MTETDALQLMIRDVSLYFPCISGIVQKTWEKFPSQLAIYSPRQGSNTVKPPNMPCFTHSKQCQRAGLLPICRLSNGAWFCQAGAWKRDSFPTGIIFTGSMSVVFDNALFFFPTTIRPWKEPNLRVSGYKQTSVLPSPSKSHSANERTLSPVT